MTDPFPGASPAQDSISKTAFSCLSEPPKDDFETSHSWRKQMFSLERDLPCFFQSPWYFLHRPLWGPPLQSGLAWWPRPWAENNTHSSYCGPGTFRRRHCSMSHICLEGNPSSLAHTCVYLAQSMEGRGGACVRILKMKTLLGMCQCKERLWTTLS